MYTNICVHNFPGGSNGKESACNEGDLGLIPGLGRSPGEGNSLPTPVFLPGEFHGQRRLAGYSPCGHRETDATDRLSLIQYLELIRLETGHLLGLMNNYQIILKTNRISKMFCDLYSTNNYFPIILNSHELYMNDGTYGNIFKKQPNKQKAKT